MVVTPNHHNNDGNICFQGLVIIFSLISNKNSKKKNAALGSDLSKMEDDDDDSDDNKNINNNNNETRRNSSIQQDEDKASVCYPVPQYKKSSNVNQTATAISASLVSNNLVASSAVTTPRSGATSKGKQWDFLTYQTHAQLSCFSVTGGIGIGGGTGSSMATMGYGHLSQVSQE